MLASWCVRSICLGILCLPFASGCNGVVTIPEATISSINSNVGPIAEFKTQVEIAAEDLRHSSVRMGSPEHSNARKLFNTSRSRHNAWIQRCILAVNLDSSLEGNAEFKAGVESAVKSCLTFIEYANSLAKPPTETPAGAIPAEVIEGVIVGLTKSGIEIWKAYHQLQAEERQAIRDRVIAQLKSLEILMFESIGSPSPAGTLLVLEPAERE